MSRPKITLVGAGSTVFAKNIIGDVLSFPELADCTISLYDIDEERLATSKIVLKPGQTYRFDFSLIRLNDPAGEPQLSDAAISPDRVTPGEQVTFEVTVKGGEGGLSPEVIAASPRLGRMVLMEPVGGDRYRATVIIPSESVPGDYSFAFFAASNACYVNSVFPMVTLYIVQA